MPELPEVETSCRGIAPFLEGGKIASIIVRQEQLRWPVPVTELKALAGDTIRKVHRRAKYIQLMFDAGYILMHLGMSGSVRILLNDEPPKKHDHVDIILENGVILRFNDPRRSGSWLYQEGVENCHPLLAKLGPEPLSDEFSAEYLYQHSRKKTQPVKSYIMDSHVVVGVGNIYAAEALFIAGIHPKREAGSISRARYEKLTTAIKQVLAAAIEQGGTTLRDYVNSEGKPGYFSQQLFVYGRKDLPCLQCGHIIKVCKLAQRSTFYCAECQK